MAKTKKMIGQDRCDYRLGCLRVCVLKYSLFRAFTQAVNSCFYARPPADFDRKSLNSKNIYVSAY